MKKKTTNEFIIESNRIHNNKYNYSLVNYINNKSRVKIICSDHGIFEQYPSDHIKGHGCSMCSNNKKYTQDEFILKCKELYKNENYGYSLVKYENNKKEINVICPKHGIFKVRPDSFIQKRNKCSKCSDLFINTDIFVKKAIERHDNKYDYSLVEYKNTETKVEIICSEHGVFKQTPHNHISNKQGCPSCCKNKKYTQDEFIKKSNEIHFCVYDYSLSEYVNNRTKVKIICKKHGIFKQTPEMHLIGNGCPTCKKSKGEKIIRNYLELNKISFIPQKKFDKCKNLLSLPFDFYLKDYNICIEFDGEQHFKPKEIWGGENGLKNIKFNDNIKNIYCKENNIKLIRIPYNEINNIENILNQKIIK